MLAAWVTSQIVFNGFVQGLVYGLLAMAIVLVYRSSKVINFAIGSMGLIGSGLLVLLTVQFGVPYWISLAIALVAGIVYGGIIELAIVRRLFTAPRVILLVATIGVSQLSAAILLAYPDIDNARAGYPLPFEREFSIGDLRIKPALLAVIVVVPLVALGLGWFLNRTLLGRTVRAAAVNPDLARLRGVSPKTISTLVWALGGGVATVAMILIGGIDGSAGTLSDLGAGHTPARPHRGAGRPIHVVPDRPRGRRRDRSRRGCHPVQLPHQSRPRRRAAADHRAHRGGI